MPASPGPFWPYLLPSAPQPVRDQPLQLQPFGDQPAGPHRVRAEPLGGGVANRDRVFRRGATVRRPRAPAALATHAVLDHLHRVGFTAAPRLLAVEGDTEVLSWIPGQAACSPLPDWSLGEDTLVSVAELIAGFHRAMRSFDGTGLRWGRPTPAAYRGGLISHNDLHPGNVIFDGGVAVGLIDFDLAGPGSVIWDLATAVRCWCPLVADPDVPPALADRRFERLALFLDAYGLAGSDRAAVVHALVANHDWTYRIVTDAARAGHPGFSDYWDEVARRTDRARAWMQGHASGLLAAAA